MFSYCSFGAAFCATNTCEHLLRHILTRSLCNRLLHNCLEAGQNSRHSEGPTQRRTKIIDRLSGVVALEDAARSRMRNALAPSGLANFGMVSRTDAVDRCLLL